MLSSKVPDKITGYLGGEGGVSELEPVPELELVLELEPAAGQPTGVAPPVVAHAAKIFRRKQSRGRAAARRPEPQPAG